MASVFRFCKAATHGGSPESITSQIIRQTQCVYVTKLWLCFAHVQSVKTIQYLEVHVAHIVLHNRIILGVEV